jgi:DNA recombination protein RmuC
LDITALIIGLIGGGLAGGLIIQLISQKARSQEQTRAQLAEQDASIQKQRVAALEQELRETTRTLEEQKIAVARQQESNKALEERLQAQRDEVDKIRDRFKVEFDNLAQRIFDEKTNAFKQKSEESISKMLDPIRDRLKDFSERVEKINKDSLEGNSALMTQLQTLQSLNKQMSDEAKNLTKALKGEQKTQGNWGEMILESLLEKSGLVKDREYTTQESMWTVEGQRLQPDVVINLPEGKKLIIDSKVSLVAYERWVNEEDENLLPALIKQHVASMKAHIKGLSEKHYPGLTAGQGGLDFVLLFVPIEPAFSLALQHDRDLFTDAFNRNIVLVSPTTLLATLRTIASIWRQEYQSQNAQEIARRGSDLYDKFVAFVEDLEKVGKNLEQVQKAYDQAMNKLSTGKGNLINRAQSMKKLGLHTKKNLTDNSAAEDEDEG